jgi:hypothetical protein
MVNVYDFKLAYGSFHVTEEHEDPTTHEITKNLRVLSAEYHNMVDMYDPNQLEIIKRKFDSEMQSLSVYYAKIKKFKGGQVKLDIEKIDDIRRISWGWANLDGGMVISNDLDDQLFTGSYHHWITRGFSGC